MASLPSGLAGGYSEQILQQEWRPALPHRLSRLPGAVFSILRDWRRRSRDRVELLGLDDHMLKDIGITRTEVLWKISKPFWRE